MSGLSFTHEQLAALEDAIAKGALVVKYTDKEIRYRSLDEMLRIRDLMRRCLGITAKGTRIRVRTCKGLH